VNEDKATRYHRLKRQAGLLFLLWTGVLMAGLVWSGVNVWLRTISESLVQPFPAGSRNALVVPVYAIGLTLIHELGALPIAWFSGFVLEHRYGLSTQRGVSWVGDQAKGLSLSVVLGTVAVTAIYACIRQWPQGWWLPASALFAVLIVGLAHLAPILLLPLFYRVKALDRDALRERLLALASRAGTHVLGVYQWGLGEKTRRANAALTGIGSSRRILVSDTMLSDYSDDEIEIVLAHELAHHVHGDVWTGLLVESLWIVAGLYAGSKALEAATGRFGVSGPADVAGLPLLVLVVGLMSLIGVPFAHAVSRAHERRADRVALELTGNPRAFVSAMRRLASQNLAEERPSRVVRWLFYSHPPTRERIEAAQAFRV
jgi:STE24 endopeptidase